ncbi:MAG: hypothetical protein WDZ45_09225 [Flavobacteriaceae bacterium]
MTHLFVALGQNHIIKFESLIKNEYVEDGQKILLGGSNVTVNKQIWDKTILSKTSFNNNASSFFEQFVTIKSKIKSYSEIINQLNEYKNDDITVYVSYIEDVLSNFIFLNFNKNSKGVVVEDGTLNYYDHSFKNINKVKFYLKKIISLYYKIKFQKYQGHSSGADYSHVCSNFLTFPEHAFVAKNAKPLPLKKEIISKPINALYIIGQEPFGNVLGLEKFYKVLNDFFCTLKNQTFYADIEKIYYKPHRNGVQLTEAYLKSFFIEKELKVIYSEKTSEELFFEEITCIYISSFNSSSLTTIYSKLPENEKSNFNFYVYPIINNELANLFQKLNFNFLNNKLTN